MGDYAERFLSAIPKGIPTVASSCNCLLNYLYGDLQDRRTGSLEGPMTFGEIAKGLPREGWLAPAAGQLSTVSNRTGHSDRHLDYGTGLMGLGRNPPGLVPQPSWPRSLKTVARRR